MKSTHIFILGFTQGVGFRWFIKRNARRLGVFGFTQNLQDGRVEAVFQGREEKIEKIIKLCEKGPFLSEVKNIDVSWKEDEHVYTDFEIRKS